MGGQKPGAIVRVTMPCQVLCHITPEGTAPPPPVKFVHLKKILHYLGYIMAITVLCIIIYIIKFL